MDNNNNFNIDAMNLMLAAMQNVANPLHAELVARVPSFAPSIFLKGLQIC